MAVAGDDRDAATVRTDLLIDQVNALLAKMDAVVTHGSSNTQTVIHKTAGIGVWGAAAVTACFCTLFGLVLLGYQTGHANDTMNNDIRDLKAWSDILRAKVTKLEAGRPAIDATKPTKP